MQIEPSVSGQRHRVAFYLIAIFGLAALFGLAANLALEGCKLGFDVSFDLPPLDDVFAITAEKIIDGFYADSDRADGLFSSRSLNENMACRIVR